ncbi:MAG: hypothetical protein ACPGRX_00905 [Bdellovibrionales bacterium]
MADRIKFLRKPEDHDIDTGRVSSRLEANSRAGFLAEDGRNFLSGGIVNDVNANDRVQGSVYDDYVWLRGRRFTPEEKPGSEHVRGKDGFDTVILDGHRHDYVVSIPMEYKKADVEEMPDGVPFLYGSVISLQDIDGHFITLQGVERIVFTGDQDFKNSKDLMKNFEERLAEGTLDSFSFKDLFLQAQAELDEKQTMEARLASTPEAYEVLTATIRGGDVDASIRQGIEAAKPAHPNIMTYPPFFSADAPTSATTAKGIGFTGELAAVPMPPPEAFR